MRRHPDGLLRSYGFSVDPFAAVGDVQAGVGWRKGDFQASLDDVHRTFRAAYAMPNIDFDNKDEMVGLSLSLRSHQVGRRRICTPSRHPCCGAEGDQGSQNRDQCRCPAIGLTRPAGAMTSFRDVASTFQFLRPHATARRR